MPIYNYKSISSSGKMISGRMEAQSESQVRISLRRSGAQPVQIIEASGNQQIVKAVSSTGKRAPSTEVASTIRQLSIFIRAGVPLVEALEGLSEQAKSESLGATLKDIASDVSQGTALSIAFSRHPRIFPTLAVEMAKVAEVGGNLAESMIRLADHLESGAEIMQRIKSAMAYPVVILIISFVTVILMSTFILPRFVKLFGQMGAEIPWSTKLLMNLSHVMITQWYLFVIAIIIIFFLIKRYIAMPSGRRHIDKLSLALPLIGDIVKKIILNRVIASMSTLLSSGVSMIQALEISAAAANNIVIKEALLRARKDVSEGNTVSQSLKVSGVFPPLVIQMVSSGEKTGELSEMLNHVCVMYERETDAKIKSLTSVIEPIMIVLLGLIVGFIAVSVILPIYSLVGGVK